MNCSGSFLPLGFLYVDNLALQGRKTEAVACFERLLGLANDVGLLSEEYEPVLGRMLGTFPQALTHVGLVNSAILLSRGGAPRGALMSLRVICRRRPICFRFFRSLGSKH